ncbi:recombinase family protein [Actinomycetospora sp. CA-101289]|uniref:recombinase family protein n=1 Tax=Actinomycetospora sp. CA-101289 TaxID=3239893 RepID=UPI003D994D59
MTTSAPRALLYGRVSAASTDGRSVDSQLDEGRKVAAREGWTIVGQHRDDGISASRYSRGKARPGWQTVMDELAGGQVDVLVVWEISRASRDRTVWAALLAACSEHRVQLAVGGKLHDPNDPDDGFMLDLTAALAVRESGMTSKRTRRNLDARAQSGDPHGRIPYGYARVYEEHSGRSAGQVVDPETAPIVREIVRRVLAGEALYSIARDLNRRNVPSPLTVTRLRNRRPTIEMPWRPEQVGRVATSPTNAGLRVCRGKVVPGVEARWEPLVSRADHAKVLEVFADPARRSTTGDSSHRHLLVGLAVCGDCSAPVRRINNRGVPSYSCSRGFHVARAMHFVDEYVTEIVLSRLEQPDVADLFAAEDDNQRTAQRQARDELAELRAILDGWYAAAVDGTVTPAGLARIESGLLARIDDAERRARPRPSSPVMRDMLTGDVRERWKEATLPARREVIRELMTVTIHRTRRGARHLDPESVAVEWK